MVGSFEDAAMATVLNDSIQAVVIYDGFAFSSRHDAPLLHDHLTRYANLDGASLAAEGRGLGTKLATLIKNFRPELDIYLITDRSVEALAASEEAAAIRRIFFDVEEALEIHLSIMDGVNDRYRTPYFSNLLNYAQRPIGTFHALPIARGKSVFHSKWIRDMGQFYGTNIFLAESSATTGGLDSLLEPTGNIKAMQELAARAFGAQRCYLATNGTSTSNKIVVHGSLRARRHHHRRPQLPQVAPLRLRAVGRAAVLRRGVPAHRILDVRRGAAAHHQEGPSRSQGGGQARPRQAGRPDELHVRRPHVQHAPRHGRVPGDQAGPHLPVGRGVVRLCPVLAAPPPTLGHGRREGASATSTAAPPTVRSTRPTSHPSRALEPNDPKLLDMRLLPDPDKVRIRAYQTNSTHKSMSAFRQGSMIAIWDEDFAKVEGTFQEAFLTHTSTSPNLQLIASLDVARRQMELEGYELTMRMTGLAMELRSRINSHPLISKYFRVATPEEMIPAEFRESGLKDYGPPHSTWRDVVSAWDEDEFALDPTRLTLAVRRGRLRRHPFKGLLAERFDIQINKTSRNSVLVQININNTRGDAAHLIKALADLSREIDDRLARDGSAAREALSARVKALTVDVPDLPNFSHFHDAFRDDAESSTSEGHMREAFFKAYDEASCEYVRLNSPEMDQRLKNGPPLVSANFVIPYPPGFPIMVPGQVITNEAITFMRKLDVKEIHGYQAARGVKVLKPDRLGEQRKQTPSKARATRIAAE